MTEHDDVEKVARALARKARVSEIEASGFIGAHLNEYVDAHWQDHADRARAAIAAMGPALSTELYDKLCKLATYLTEQGEYEACDLIDTVVERLTPKAKG